MCDGKWKHTWLFMRHLTLTKILFSSYVHKILHVSISLESFFYTMYVSKDEYLPNWPN